MPSKSSLIKIAFALAVICFYTYVFAIMDVVEIAADPSGEAAFSHEQGHPSTPNNPHDSRNPVATTIDIRNPPVPRLEDYEEAPAPQVLPDEFSDSHGGYETFLPPDYFESSYTAATDGTSAPATALTTNLTTVLTTAPATALTTAPTTAPTPPTPPTTTRPSGTLTPASTTTARASGTLTPTQTAATTTTTRTAAPTAATTAANNPNTAGETFRVRTSGTLIEGDAFEIVTRVVEAEIGGGFHAEAIKAQVIAAYTYIKRHNETGSIPNLPTRPQASERVLRYAREVWGQAIYHEGALIQAAFSASSAGWTSSALNVWGRDIPYLQSRRTAFDEQHDPRWQNTRIYTAAEIRENVLRETKIALSGDPAAWLAINGHVDTVYVGQMTIGGQTSYTAANGSAVQITGRVFREQIMAFNLRSASFTFTYNRADDTFIFTTNGFGHGVGMSQNGANSLATHLGYSYREILLFYYQGVTVR